MLVQKKEDFKSEIDRCRDYRTVFGTETGQRVLWDLAKNCHFLSHTFSPDSHRMALQEGERNALLRILSILDRDPTELEQRAKQGVDEE